VQIFLTLDNYKDVEEGYF